MKKVFSSADEAPNGVLKDGMTIAVEVLVSAVSQKI